METIRAVKNGEIKRVHYRCICLKSVLWNKSMNLAKTNVVKNI